MFPNQKSDGSEKCDFFIHLWWENGLKKCCAVHSHLLKNQLSVKVVKLVLKFMLEFLQEQFDL